MKYLKLAGILMFIVLLFLGWIIFNPDVSNKLTSNIKKNIYRSFRDAGMETQISKLSVDIIKLGLKWSKLKINRENLFDLPNSWLHIFQNVSLSGCNMRMGTYWFKLHLELNCSKIELSYIPLKWFFVPSLNREYASDFYFSNSEFMNFESKQGWLRTTIKSDYFFLNGKDFGPLNLSYYFKKPTELWILPTNSKEKIIFRSMPGQLKIFNYSSMKNYGILTKNIFFEIRKIL